MFFRKGRPCLAVLIAVALAELAATGRASADHCRGGQQGGRMPQRASQPRTPMMRSMPQQRPAFRQYPNTTFLQTQPSRMLTAGGLNGAVLNAVPQQQGIVLQGTLAEQQYQLQALTFQYGLTNEIFAAWQQLNLRKAALKQQNRALRAGQ